MKKLIVALLLLPFGAFSQIEIAPEPSVVKNVWRAAFLAPGVINETRLGDRTTLVSEFRFVSISKTREIEVSPTEKKSYTSYTFNPALSVAPRHYYNFARRLEKGKSIRYNSGNYLSLRARYVLPALATYESVYVPIGNNSGIDFAALWGFQRTYRRNFYLNLALGLGYGHGVAGITGDFILGYTFPNKNAE